MAVKLRMTGEPDEIARIMHELQKILDVATDGRTYEQRGGFGVRTYAEVRLPSTPSVTVDRPDPRATPLDPPATPSYRRIEWP